MSDPTLANTKMSYSYLNVQIVALQSFVPIKNTRILQCHDQHIVLKLSKWRCSILG